MSRPVALAAAAILLLVAAAAAAWFLGAGYAVLSVLPNSCDPAGARLHALERDPLARAAVGGSQRRLSFPATSALSNHCRSASVELDVRGTAAQATYALLQSRATAAGWSKVNEGMTGDGRPLSSYTKSFDSWQASMDLSIDRDSTVVMVMRAPPVNG